VWPVQIGSESLPTSLIVFHYTMSQKGSSTFFVYKLNKHYLTLIIFGRNVTQKLSTQKLVYFPAHLNLTSASALRCRTRKQHLFSQTFYYCFARLQLVDAVSSLTRSSYSRCRMTPCVFTVYAVLLSAQRSARSFGPGLLRAHDHEEQESRGFRSSAVDLCCTHDAQLRCLPERQQEGQHPLTGHRAPPISGGT